MLFWNNSSGLLGVISGILQFGIGGPRLRNDAGVLRSESPDGASLAPLSVGTPSASDHAATNGQITSLKARPWQIILSSPSSAPTTGYQGTSRAGYAGTITAVVVDCDANHTPASNLVDVALYTVNRTTGTRTAVLSADAQIAIGGTTGSGTVNGSNATVAVDTLLEAEIVQADSAVRSISITVTIQE